MIEYKLENDLLKRRNQELADCLLFIWAHYAKPVHNKEGKIYKYNVDGTVCMEEVFYQLKKERYLNKIGMPMKAHLNNKE